MFKLAKYFKNYAKIALTTPLFVIGEALLEVSIPFLMAKIIDVGVANKDINYILLTGLLMIGMAFLSLVCGAIAGKFGAWAATGLAKNIRQNMYYKIQDYAFSNIDKFSTASLITRLTTDVNIAQDTVQMSLRALIRAPIMLIAATSMAFNINSRLTLVFLCAIPFLGIALFTLIFIAFPKFLALFKKYDKLNSVVQENLIAIRTVKSFVREDYEIKKFQDASSDIMNYAKKAEKIVILNMPIMQFTVFGCILAISWFGGNQIIQGRMTTGQLTSFLSYIMQILMSLMIISMLFVNIIMTRAAANRILEVIDETPDITPPKNPVTEVADGSIEFENVSFSYKKNDNYVLSNINLKIEHGQTIGLIGGTGSSKSSLVQLIPRLYDVTKGRVLVGGVDVRDYDIKTLRDSVGIVLQKNVLFSGTIEENLRWGSKDATMDEIVRACKIAQAHDFITSFSDGYQTYLDQGGVNLSGGQRQRLCIARAILKNPKVLIFDDSTSAVDTNTDALIRKALKTELKDMTKIIIAQRVASIEDADKIIILDEGQIAGLGTHDELIKTNDIYKDVYFSQKNMGEQNE
ncbi:MAG TPA: ABC transporter ATP-binding protein [Clostridiales bacterium]|jgi:ATP-binding cassette subfamily B protein|nr:ABC transporter ATP-binding protein [Clostridiales bacterium]